MGERIQKVPDIYTIAPLPDSLVMARKTHNKEASQILEMRASLQIGLVVDFSILIEPDTLLGIFKTAAQVGSEDLMFAAKVRMYHDYDTLLLKLTREDRRELFNLESELYINKAVEYRDKAAELGKARDSKEASRNLKIAGYYHLLAYDLGMVPSPDDDLLFEYNEEFISNDNDSFVELLFDEMVCYTADEIDATLFAIRIGEQVDESVDRGWELVRYYLHPDPEEYPQAFVGFNILLSRICQENGVSEEQVRRFAEWRAKEALDVEIGNEDKIE